MHAVIRAILQSAKFHQSAQFMQITNNAARQINMKIIKFRPLKKETLEERNRRLGNILSPSLSIYKPQLTSVLSITHRITGFALSVYVTTFALGTYFSKENFEQYLQKIVDCELSCASLAVLKGIIAYPVAYHSTNGIRHLLWDSGRFLKWPEIYRTGYIMLAASLVFTAAIIQL